MIAQIFRDGPNGRHSTDVKYFLRYETSLLDDLHSRAEKNGVKAVRTGESDEQVDTSSFDSAVKKFLKHDDIASRRTRFCLLMIYNKPNETFSLLCFYILLFQRQQFVLFYF